MEQKFAGAVEGFVATKVIYNVISGYIGYLPSDKSIYVAFKGTTTDEEWVVDYDNILVDYTIWPECNCKVHHGWYQAVENIWSDLFTEVSRLSALFPDYQVKVTGHSLGASLA